MPFEGLIPTVLDTAKETFFELEDMTTESSQTEKQTEKRLNNQTNKRTEYPRTAGQLQKV